MRLLFLAQFFPPDIGGEERHVFNLATTAMSLPGMYSGSRMHHPPVPDPLGVRELSRIVSEERPDVVHAHNWVINSALALRRHSAARPQFGLVLTLHDYSQICATKRLMRAGIFCAGPKASRCLPCASAQYGPIIGPMTVAATSVLRSWKEHAIDHIVSVSRAVADANRIPDRPTSSIIPNFVLDSAMLSSATSPSMSASGDSPFAVPEEPFLLFVGELSGDKGIHVLLTAYESLGSHRPKLLLVGRRTLDTPTRLPDGVVMHMEWPHENILAAFQRCMAAVLPSVCADACPTTVLEAMACGRPVIATSIGGIVDMIVDEESGLLVAPGDANGLAAAIDRVLADGELRKRLSAGARARVRAFTASAVAEQLEAVYAQVAPRLAAVTTAAITSRGKHRASPGLDESCS